MAIEEKWWPWKPSLYTQYRIRIANELRLAQRNELHRQLTLVEDDITQILKQMTPIDFTFIDQKVDSSIEVSQSEQKRTLREYRRVKKQLIQLAPKLLIGNAYLRAQCDFNDLPIKTPKKIRKRLKLTIEQQWKKGIGDVYRRLQAQRDKEDVIRHDEPVNISIPIEPLSIVNEYPVDEPPIIFDEIKEHEFLPPLPPPPLDESNGMIIPFKTPPPIVRRSPPSDQLQLATDDTIVKPHRLVNRTLGNMSHMSFHIDPDQCSSPKTNEKKKKNKLKALMPPPPPPPAPLFSSTAIFDTHAFFTQTNSKTKKQKKKIDIARQPVIMTTNDIQKKKGRTKKNSLYDFQDDDNTTLSQSKGAKLLTDDIITARFAKNSHYHSHQSSMASTKSSKSQHKSNEREHKKTKKKKKNILGIGTSSPLTLSANLTLSPGRLSTDDKDDEYEIKSSSTRHHNRTKTNNKSKRTRVK